MPITVGWDNNTRTAIRCDFDVKWTWNDVFAMNREIETMMDSVNHPVCVMIKMAGNAFPQSGTLTYTKHLFLHDHPNYANHVIFIDGSALIKTFERIIRKAYVQSMYNIHSDYVESIENARHVVNSKHKT